MREGLSLGGVCGPGGDAEHEGSMGRQDNAQVGQCPGRTMPSGRWEKKGCVEVFACGDRGMAGWGRRRVHAWMEHKGVVVK